MKFETKAVLIFTLIVIVGFSILNSIAFLYYKNTLENSLIKEALVYLKLYNFDSSVRLPEYAKILRENEPLPSTDFIPFLKKQDKIFYIKESFFKEKYTSFFVNFLLWDTVLILGLYVFFYYTIIRYIKREANLRKALELSVLSISHKLGNFLSINKMNLELLKERCPSKEVERLIKSYNSVEKDFKHISEILKSLDTGSKTTVVNVKTIIEKSMRNFENSIENKNLLLNLKDYYLRTEEEKLKIVIQNLIENAVKYSNRFIHIKMCSKKQKLILVIRNDINSNQDRNTGLGLSIIEKLLPDLNGKIKYRAGKNSYISVLTLLKK